MVFNKKALREGIGRADKKRIMRLGRGVEAIDKPIQELGETFREGQSKVGKKVTPIDKRKRNIFDPL